MHSRQPFDPSKLSFYYGWVIVAVGAIGMIASFPGQTAGVSVFTDDLTATTGLSRLQLANAYLIGTTTSGLLLPFGGRWIDQFGTRIVALGATLGLAVTITALSFVGPMGTATGMTVMAIGFFFLRFCGQGMLTLSSRTMIAQWFDRRRGLVSSIATASVSFVFAATPLLLHRLIEFSDFRWAWRQLAAGLVLIIGTIVVVFYRNRPEDVGLVIDGDANTQDDRDNRDNRDNQDTQDTRLISGDQRARRQPTVTETDYTRAQAIRDLRFWVVTLPAASLSVVGTALTFHIVDLGREVGMNEATIVRIFIPIAVVSVPVSLIGGYLADRVPVVSIGIAAAVLQIAMYLTAARLDHPLLQLIAVGSWGAATGCFSALTAAALPRLFGRTHLGAIAGVQMSAMVIGSAIGPAFFAFVEQTAGSYQRALQFSLVGPLSALALAAVHFARPRHHH